MVSLGLSRAFSRMGKKVKPFKKGPDYIDAAWLHLAAESPTTNLDSFFFSPDVIRALFKEKSAGFDISVVEGNRGLFDGKDLTGSCSTSELARVLGLPVILVMDCTKMTRTAAALVAGCKNFEPGLDLAGVVLNRTAGPRHRKILTESIENLANVPVVGALPKMPKPPIPERHMGLVSDREFGRQDEILNSLADTMEKCLDLDKILDIANRGKGPETTAPVPWPKPVSGPKPVIGYIMDQAFWFYYPENLEALERAGAGLEKLSCLDGEAWPELDGLYIGGGFPETMPEKILANADKLDLIKKYSDQGMPIYAECGGFMLLCRALETGQQEFPMAGVFDMSTHLCAKPQGLGYTEAVADRKNPFHPEGVVLKGHEFHYSLCRGEVSGQAVSCLEMVRGKGVLENRDGLLYKNTFAGYNHTHALSVPHWAPNFVAACRDYALEKAASE